jgi:hypothetical protein
VAVEVLRGGMEHDVGAERQGLRQHRGGDGGVDRQDGAGAMGGFAAAAMSMTSQVGLTGVSIHTMSVCGVIAAASAWIGGVEEGNPDTPLALQPLQPVAGAVIHHRRGHDVAALRHGLEQRHDRRHARPEQARRVPALERGDRGFGMGHRRVAVAQVAGGAAQGIVGVAGIGGRGVERRHHGAGLGVEGAQGCAPRSSRAAAGAQTCWPPLMCSSAPFT